jgi:hypothetical protein
MSIEKKILGEDLLVEKFTKTARRLRYDFVDELPPDVVHSNSENALFKCRHGWFQAVSSLLSAVCRHPATRNKVHEVAGDEITVFRRDYSAPGCGFKNRLTTASDIAFCNSLLDKMLKVLEEEVSP